MDRGLRGRAARPARRPVEAPRRSQARGRGASSSASWTPASRPSRRASPTSGLAGAALWNGACEGRRAVPDQARATTSSIGARWFVDGFGRGNIRHGRVLPPRRATRSATARTSRGAVGDAGVDPRRARNTVGVDKVTGIAPAAHLAVYKACWQYGECSRWTSSPPSTPAVARRRRRPEPVARRPSPIRPRRSTRWRTALLNADAAGVSVSVAAGNAGDYRGRASAFAGAPSRGSRPSAPPPARARSARRCTPPGRLARADVADRDRRSRLGLRREPVRRALAPSHRATRTRSPTRGSAPSGLTADARLAASRRALRGRSRRSA